MKIRKLAAAAAIAGSAVLLAPSGAMAGQNSASITLPAGNRVCVDVLAPAYRNARVDAWSTRGVKFTFLVKTAGSTVYSTIAETGDGAISFGPSTASFLQPYYFPGSFRACARNNGSQAANVTISLRTDF